MPHSLIAAKNVGGPKKERAHERRQRKAQYQYIHQQLKWVLPVFGAIFLLVSICSWLRIFCENRLMLHQGCAPNQHRQQRRVETDKKEIFWQVIIIVLRATWREPTNKVRVPAGCTAFLPDSTCIATPMSRMLCFDCRFVLHRTWMRS